MPIQFFPGVQPNDPTKPRLKLSNHLIGPVTTPIAPAVVDYIGKVTNWPMYLNDQEGDCTFAAKGHEIQALSTYGQGKEIRVTDDDVQKGYVAVSGYNPMNGTNDDGAVIQETMSYWRKTGVGGHKIRAFAEVNVKDRAEVNAALNIFGMVEIGFDFPQSGMDQFNSGQPWSVVPGSPIKGGHDVCVEGYNSTSGNLRVITWGAVQEMTQTFWDKYVTEAWIVITDEWLDVNGHNPGGIDLYGLGEEFAVMTGSPNPFPAPTPSPTPVPVPTPDPIPTPTPSPVDPHIDLALAAVAQEWVTHKRYTTLNKDLKTALTNWLRVKGY